MTAKRINLALQGGGAHGAYTWGVLDRLLEEPDLSIEGISGTSAGAMNAAMMVTGYIKGGREGAKEYLEKFWLKISEVAAFSPLRQMPLERLVTGWNMDFSPSYHWFDMLSRLFSPYELNPLNINPLRTIIDDMIDHDSLRACSLIKLFVTATHVASGQARVFQCPEMSTDVLLASACIPFLFQAVQIDGEEYWDGGYMGNPAIWPLIYHCQSEDVVLVQINPIHDHDLPRTANEIINRINEISFNSSLIAEMRAIDFVSKLLREGNLDSKRYKDMRMHLIYSSDHMHHLDASSKMNADWDFFRFLKEIGRQCATRWLEEHWDNVGVTSTVDINRKFLCGPGAEPGMGDLSERQVEKVVKKVKKGVPVKKAVNEVLEKEPDKNKQKQPKKREGI